MRNRQTREINFFEVDAHKTNNVLGLIHSNICEIDEHIYTKYKYFLGFIDDLPTIQNFIY
jgi:hypothetical protein